MQPKAVLLRTRLTAILSFVGIASMPVWAMMYCGRERMRELLEQGVSEVWRDMVPAAALMLLCMVLGWAGRMQAYKAHWQQDRVTAEGYQLAQLRYQAGMVGGQLVALGFSAWAGHPMVSLALAPVGLGMIMLGFPNGKAMDATPVRLRGDE